MKQEVPYKDIGVRIKKIRKQTSYTQATLAEAAGFSTAYIANIERGSQVSLTALYNISRVLQVSMDYLLGLTFLTEDAQERVKKLFVDCTPQQQEFLLTALFDLYQNLKRHAGELEF